MELWIIFLGVVMSLTSVMVISVKNPIQALLWLILSYFIMIVIFLMIGMDFLSLLLLLVYVGAVAVLFLFVIMMLNMSIIELRESYLHYIPISAFIFIFFCFFIVSLVFFELNTMNFFENGYIKWINFIYFFNSVKLIALILYAQLLELFFVLTLLLFISMMASIILIIGWYSVNDEFRGLSKKYMIVDNRYDSIF